VLANPQSTQVLYNQTASRWARPAILELCEPVAGLRILDLGCGEGYCSRALHQRGAATLLGMDLSEGMIEAARSQEAIDQFGIHYQVGCATELPFSEGEFDLVVAVFLFNYLTIDQTQRCMAEVARVLRPGGRFIFSVPHPAFPFMREADYPFYFQVEEAGYFSQRDQQFPGRIWKRDGAWLDVQLVHKTFQDYFQSLALSGFTTMPVLRELRVTPEHVAIDEAFFKPLFDYPLHLAIQVTR
jgi:ubiquinone/menaquinone biosynthesis C-methylase UbiE